MGIGAAIGGIASGLLGASSANKAAKAQSKAADQQYQLQKQMYDQTRSDLGGYRDAGSTALQAMMYEMGLGSAPTVGGTTNPLAIETVTTPGTGTGQPLSGMAGFYDRTGFMPTGNNDTASDIRNQVAQAGTPGSTQYRVNGQLFSTLEEAQKYAGANGTTTGGKAYGGFTATPGYQFRLNSGNDSINALAGARGGLNSGATMKALADYNQGAASEEYGNYMARLSGITDMGQASAANTAQASNAFAQGGANALANKGNAQAAGAAGVGNALQNGLSTGISLWQYQKGLGSA